jgi:hypothetical protein
VSGSRENPFTVAALPEILTPFPVRHKFKTNFDLADFNSLCTRFQNYFSENAPYCQHWSLEAYKASANLNENYQMQILTRKHFHSSAF